MPSPPQLTAILRDHLAEHGTTPGGRLVRGSARAARDDVARPRIDEALRDAGS